MVSDAYMLLSASDTSVHTSFANMPQDDKYNLQNIYVLFPVLERLDKMLRVDQSNVCHLIDQYGFVTGFIGDPTGSAAGIKEELNK